MNEDDKPVFVGLMKRLALTFSKPLDDVLLMAYYDALDDLDAAELSEAAREYCRKGTRWPVPAELRGGVAEVKRLRRDREERQKLLERQREYANRVKSLPVSAPAEQTAADERHIEFMALLREHLREIPPSGKRRHPHKP